MVATKNLKEEILEQLKTKRLARISASEKDYFSVAYKIPFKVEYHDSEIITMGLASYWHELLVTNIIILLNKMIMKI